MLQRRLHKDSQSHQAWALGTLASLNIQGSESTFILALSLTLSRVSHELL